MRAAFSPRAARPSGLEFSSLGSDVSAAEVDLFKEPIISVILYSQPSCQPCRLIGNEFEAKGVPFEVVDISAPENARLLSHYRERGFASTPIITDGADIEFAGFQPHLVQEVINRYGK